MKTNIPHVQSLNGIRDFINEGYLFIQNRVEQYNSDIFETSILGKTVVFLSGGESAKVFYNPVLFQRNHATPKRIQKTLFGIDAIQTMDGKEHIHRKKLFMSLMTKPYENKLCELVMRQWTTTFENLIDSNKTDITLFHITREVLCKAACNWAGVPLKESEIQARADDFTAMVDAFGAVGPRHWNGRLARTRTEEWIKGFIEDVRNGSLEVDKESPIYKMSFHREIDGELLDSQMAAIELINIIRPIIAISIYIVFAMTALYEHPQYKDKLTDSNSKDFEMFSLEVRRYYPIAPFLGALVKNDFAWKDYVFKKDTLVILDIYGTNHESKFWTNPYEFNPERFNNWKGNKFNFIPQGGGSVNEGHRCPGEGITMKIIKISLDFLINSIDYKVPEQDLSYSLVKMPTLPESGYIMTDIRFKTKH